MDPLKPILLSVTDFLSLWDNGLIQETICSYHSALVSVFKYSGGSTVDIHEVAALPMNYNLEWQLQSMETLQWCFYLILDFLERPLLEPCS